MQSVNNCYYIQYIIQSWCCRLGYLESLFCIAPATMDGTILCQTQLLMTPLKLDQGMYIKAFLH